MHNTDDGMEHIADLKTKARLYRERSTGKFLLIQGADIEVIPWEEVAHSLAIGELLYEDESGERRLLGMLRECERAAEQREAAAR